MSKDYIEVGEAETQWRRIEFDDYIYVPFEDDRTGDKSPGVRYVDAVKESSISIEKKLAFMSLFALHNYRCAKMFKERALKAEKIQREIVTMVSDGETEIKHAIDAEMKELWWKHCYKPRIEKIKKKILAEAEEGEG